MKAKANRDVGPRMNTLNNTMNFRLSDFVMMNSPTFLGSKVEEDAQEFLDGVYKVLSAMGVTYREKTELAFVPIKGG